MRLKLLLPRVEPSEFEEPRVCPKEKCGGKHFHQRTRTGCSTRCVRKHVLNNREAWHATIQSEWVGDSEGLLAKIGVTSERAVADNDERLRLIRERQPASEVHARLVEIPVRCAEARSPNKLGQDKETLAYRLRLFSLDRWNLWQRLTRYRTWWSSHGERLSGSNNATERAVGWRVKERCRTVRGYKRRESVLNVCRLIAWDGNLLNAGGADRAAVVAWTRD